MTSKSGFTLVELLITLAILSIVIAAVTKLFMSTNRTYANNQAILRVQQDVRLSSSFLARDLRKLGNSVTFDDFYETALDQCGYVYYLEEDPDTGETTQTQIPGSSGDSGPGRITSIQLIYYDEEGNITPNISDAKQIEYEICGSPPEDTPYISDNYDYCVEDVTVTTRNLHYQ